VGDPDIEPELDRLRRSEALYRLTIENISDAIFVTDDAGRWRYVCPNCHVIFGWTAEDVERMDDLGALLGADVIEPARLDREGQVDNVPLEVADRAGETHHVLVTLKRVAILDGTVLVAIRDVTERHRLERRLEQRRRLAALERFARGVAHDIKNWLLAIRAAADFLALPERDEETREAAADIEMAVDGASQLVRDLSAFVRGESLRATELSVGDQLEDARSVLARLAEPHTLSLEVEPGLPDVTFDASSFLRIVTNLVKNAAEAMGEPGTVEVHVGVSALDAPELAACDEVIPPARYVEVAIVDRGPDLPEGVLEHAFEPYFTTKRRRNGGIGLAASLGLARRGGAYLRLARADPGVTRASLFVPIERAS